ncbi:unnamed protein product, partial [Symbiodinium pilosum]
AKPVWLEKYRSNPKARRAFQAGWPVFANLEQNPSSRPIISRYLPCLLRSGLLWLLKPGEDEEQLDNERPLTGQEHMQAMAIPMMDELVCAHSVYPHFRGTASQAELKKLAGN